MPIRDRHTLHRPSPASGLRRLYRNRFGGAAAYRDAVWGVLVRGFFQRYVSPSSRVLDLGCGWGAFINHIQAAEKLALDLNPDAANLLLPGVTFFSQDSTQRWPLPENHLDWVFTSNFLEHLPSKVALEATLREAARCLKPKAGLICMGPNIRHVGGAYWDFFDHHIPLTERSLAELLTTLGFEIELVRDRFLPYTMVDTPRAPLLAVHAYLRLPWAWKCFGGQFLVVARKQTNARPDAS